MTWFKVDDSFHSHVKAMRAGEAALGLWVLAGSWCAAQLTDGWIPAYAAKRLSPNADTLAAELVSAGLWAVEERDGESGWVFCSWEEYQPSRESVEQRRKADTERRARWREAKKTDSSQHASRKASRRDTRRESREASRGVSVLPGPARPGPDTSNDVSLSSSTTASAEQSKPEPTRTDVNQLCTRLRDQLHAIGAKATITEAWKREGRLLLDRDGRDLSEALQLIDWTTNDPFWRANVLSMSKFRQKYDQLRLKSQQGQQTTNGHQPFRNPDNPADAYDPQHFYAQAFRTDDDGAAAYAKENLVL